MGQQEYEALYNAASAEVRSALRSVDVTEAVRQAADSFLRRNGSDLLPEMVGAAERAINEWLDRNREDILAAIAAGGKGGDS